MKTTINFIAIGILLIATSQSSLAQETAKQSNFSMGVNAGYNRGVAGQFTLTAHKPLATLPLDFRIGFGYTRLDPGNSSDARRIFINNATNGVPEEKAKSFDYRLDALWPISIGGLEKSYFSFGPRYSSFRANFKYVGGNEDFDVTTKQFGLGLGAESHFKMGKRLVLVLAIGGDYFFDNTLTGHDTVYNPDDDNVNPRNDNQNNDTEFTYADADEAIKQPEIMPRIFVGILYAL